MDFPKGFLWGAACASYQCEGAWNEDGKSPSIWDEFSHTPGHVKNGDTGDTACDSYHQAEADLALIRDMGLQVYRFSLSWSRILPEGVGEVNPLGFVYYDKLVDGLLAMGVEPWITLYHWDLPAALQRKGGWLDRETIDAFARYTQVVGEHFKGKVKCYMPINEPQCVAVLGYGTGEHAPGLKLDRDLIAIITHHLTVAWSRSARVLRAIDPTVRVGAVTCGQICTPGDPAWEEAAYAATFRLDESSLHSWAFTHNIFLDSLFQKGYDPAAPDFLHQLAKAYPKEDWDEMERPDFIGLNIYKGTPVDAAGTPLPFPPGYPHTAIGWPVTPEVLYYAPRHFYARYGLPMVITENGLSCNDIISLDGQVHDPGRIDFLRRYLTALGKAIQSGAPVEGYLQWSLLDNFEWAEGYSQRFGLVYVDYADGNRIPKDSARWYGQVARENRVE